MRVAIGSDHAGYVLKLIPQAELEERGHDVADLGTHDADKPVDHPDYGAPVVRAVADAEVDLGVRVRGSGIGISMAANKSGLS